MFIKLLTSTVLIKLLDPEPDPNQEQKFRIRIRFRLKKLGSSRIRIRIRIRNTGVDTPQSSDFKSEVWANSKGSLPLKVKPIQSNPAEQYHSCGRVGWGWRWGGWGAQLSPV